MSTVERFSRSSPVTALVASVVICAAIAATRRWWLSATVASVVAALLWRRHPRARFAAYVFCTALAVRGVATGSWLLAAYPVVVVALMQTATARRAWPRLAPGRLRDAGDRMRRS